MPNASSLKPLGQLASHVGGEVVGDPSLPIVGVNGLSEAGPRDLSFYGSAKYKRQLESTRAGAVLVSGEIPQRAGLSYVRVPNPHLAFARISALFHPSAKYASGVRPGAHVHPEARVHPDATVMAAAVVEKGAEVGARTVLYPGVFVGEGALIGHDCILYSNVTVRERCIVGARVILHPSAVIGADGFGFAFDPEVPEHFKVPQAGIARIEDDVEVGACSCIDRATTGETVVGRGTKIDNLVQIAHNVKIGALSIICAQCGVAGSSEIGSGVVMAGQVGVVGHIKVGDLVKVGSRAAIAQDVEAGSTITGYPAIDHQEWLKNVAAFPRLAGLVKEVRELKKKMEALEKERAAR